MSAMTSAGIRAGIASAAKTGKPVELFDSNGAKSGPRCRCYPSGIASFSVVATGKRHLLDTALGCSIPDARAAAHRMKWRIQQGDDPAAEKRAAKVAATPPPKLGPTIIEVGGFMRLPSGRTPTHEHVHGHKWSGASGPFLRAS